MDVNAGLLASTNTVDGSLNFPDVWYSPTPPVGIALPNGDIDNTISGTTGSADITITFDQAVSNPRFHFLNLDNSSVSFVGVNPTFLSGNPPFDVVGTDINAIIPVGTLGACCANAAGGGSDGACGSVELAGSFNIITFIVTDMNTVLDSGDGFSWTVSAAAGPILPTATPVPTLSPWNMALFMMSLLALGLFYIPRTRKD